MRRIRKGDTAKLGGLFGAIALALALAIPANAAAQADQPQVGPGYEEFAGCPIIPPEESGIDLCMRISATGQLVLGNVSADIDEPLELLVGVGASLSGDDPAVYVAEDESPSEPIMIPGGLLGIPELDPLIEPLDVLKLLTIGADPQLGGPDAQIADLIMGALFAPDGQDLDEMGLPASFLGLPLSIQLENTLFGDRCYIGTPDEPIQIGLTTGETSPPDGTDPISGNYGVVHQDFFEDGSGGVVRVLGNRFVDNAFAVPGARNCNTLTSLGLGDTAIESLVNADSLINSQTGLPSEAGRNSAEFDFDFHIAPQDLVVPQHLVDPAPPHDFGEVTVGEASEYQKFTITRNRLAPREFQSSVITTPPSAGFEVGNQDCTNQVLEFGESCEVEVRFAPPSSGAKSGSMQIGVVGAAGLIVPLTGTAVAP